MITQRSSAPYSLTFAEDEEIKEEICDEIWWSPFVDSEDVEVTVHDGVATLSGTVQSRSERDAALENAYEGGATWVVNDLVVDRGGEAGSGDN